MIDPRRDHLFISYASEDGAFADWLALKLTAEGYPVWCDRFKLLGGESYPHDIDAAIKERTFRLLALLSKDSISKPNPLKERTLALNLARERKEDFLIPLNIDGRSPTELDWMLSDLSYISFHRSWADGFAALLKKLESISAPRPMADGRRIVSQWFASRDGTSPKPERLWTNLLEIKAVPTLMRVRVADPLSFELASTWLHFAESSTVLWALEGPKRSDLLDIVEVEEIAWDYPNRGIGPLPMDVATNLFAQHLRALCLRKGMAESSDGKYIYFPPELLANNRLSLTRFDGKRTWVSAAGERTFRISAGEHESTRYHLAPAFLPSFRKYGRPVVQVQMRVYLTDSLGRPLSPRKAVRRRRAICKNWWNYEWLARLLGVAAWLGDGAETINLGFTSPGLCLAAVPLQLSASEGLDEAALSSLKVLEEADFTDQIYEDEVEEGWDDEGKDGEAR